MDNTQYNAIFHNPLYTQTACEVVAKSFDHWQQVRNHYDLVKIHLEKVANDYIRRQNEIHSKIEFKRPWANALHTLMKFDYLGDKVKLYLVDSREVITGESNPIKTLEISKDLITNAYNQESLDSFFKRYADNLKACVELAKKNAEELTTNQRRADWEAAKKFYFAYKDEFEKDPDPIDPLPFEQWRQIYFSVEEMDEKVKTDLKEKHGIDADKEIEDAIRFEYNWYVDQCQKGIK